MKSLRFSIITICFNSEKTIKSVLAQTYKDYEYIIVDGGSKDGTLDIVKKYEPLFEGRMKWKSEPDKGIYDAMNKGISMATGDIIGIVNSDDWLEADALQKVNNAFEGNRSKLDTLYCGGIYYHSDWGKETLAVNLKSFYKSAKLYLMSGIRHPGTFVPKKIYNEIGCFDPEMKISADRDFILRCFYSGYYFLDIKSIVSNMSDGGLSTGGGKEAARKSKFDRKKSLKNFKITGFKFYWLYYIWLLRLKVKEIAIRLKLIKGH